MSSETDNSGYFGIVVPATGEFTGAFLMSDADANSPPFKQAIRDVVMKAMLHTPMAIPGTLSALMVEGASTGRTDIVAITSRAYADFTKIRHFAVIAERDAGGTHTRIVELPSDSIAAARKGLEDLPEVVAIKLKIQAGLKGTRSN